MVAKSSDDRHLFPRPLTSREAETLRFMLSVEDHRLAPLRTQAETATVEGMCTCGCATIYLAVDRTATPSATGLSRVPLETHSIEETDPRSVFGLVLFLDEGYLSSLEIWYLDAVPSEFPPTAVFRPPRMTD